MTTIAIHRRRQWRVLIGVAAFCLFGAARNGAAAGAMENKSAPGTFTLGLVSEVNRSAIEAHFADFAAYVARKLSGATKTQGKVVVAASPEENAAHASPSSSEARHSSSAVLVGFATRA